MRDRPTSTIPFHPNAAGIIWNSSSAATPTVVQSHITALATVANMARGTGCPGLAAFHWRMATIIRRHQIHDADDDQHQADVEPRCRRQRRVEGVEDGRIAADHAQSRHKRSAMPIQNATQANFSPGNGRFNAVSATK